MLYIIFSVFILLGAAAIFLLKFKFKKHEKLLENILNWSIIGLFFLFFFCFTDNQFTNPYLKFTGPMEPFFNAIGNISYWMSIVVFILLVLRKFFDFDVSKLAVKWIATPLAILCSTSMLATIIMLQGNSNWSLIAIIYPIYIALALTLCAYYWISDFKLKANKRNIINLVLIFFGAAFVSMPPYMPSFIFGDTAITQQVYDLSNNHITFIICCAIVLPFLVYFLLRNKEKEKIRYVLLIIAIGTLSNFMTEYKLDKILVFKTVAGGSLVSLNNLFFELANGVTVKFTFELWNFPFHLCHMAMFLIPICLIFKTKRLFYCTYFINVFGALMAFFMPTVGKNVGLFNPGVIAYWFNHCCAYGMPILCVALKIFDRPKFYQYRFAIVGFSGYFLAMVFINTLFTGLGHPTDFFFLNSSFIADKLGDAFKNLFKNYLIQFSVNGHTFVIHWAYLIVYFIVYCALGLIMWFIYLLLFDVSDLHKEAYYKFKVNIKNNLLERKLSDKRVKVDGEGQLIISHVFKKYKGRKNFASNDINLTINKGNVLGLLGPNGAGKSTVIKSIVGIHPFDSGEIIVDGYDSKTQPSKVKSIIGYVPDHYNLYEYLTGREYINYIADIYHVSKKTRNERIEKYVKDFELEHSIDNKIRTYSHGMKQKITIIAALVHNPKLWILDEPLTGLDPTSIYQVKQCMMEHAQKGNIVVFSSHIIDIVEKVCDHIAIIKDGRLIDYESVKEIEKKTTLEKYCMKVFFKRSGAKL